MNYNNLTLEEINQLIEFCKKEYKNDFLKNDSEHFQKQMQMDLLINKLEALKPIASTNAIETPKEIDEHIAKSIALKILEIFKHDGYSLVSEGNGLIVVNGNDESYEYESWNELLQDWVESVKVDVDNDLYYLTEEEYKILGISAKKKKFDIPVIYSVSGMIEVEGFTLKNAIEYAEDNLRDLGLPKNVTYVEDSFEIDAEGAYLFNEID